MMMMKTKKKNFRDINELNSKKSIYILFATSKINQRMIKENFTLFPKKLKLK